MSCFFNLPNLQELGLSFMAAGFDSFLEEQARNENTLLDRIYDLVETELIRFRVRNAPGKRVLRFLQFLSIKHLKHLT